MIPLAPHLWVFPIIHGNAACSLALRKHLQSRTYARILLPLPQSIQAQVELLVDELPVIHGLVLRQEESCAYFPADPCDAYIEAIRQTRQSRVVLQFVGPDQIPNPRSALGFPDPWSLEGIDFRSWILAHWPVLATSPEAVDSPAWFAKFAHNIQNAMLSGQDTILLCHISEFAELIKALEFPQPLSHLTELPPITTEMWPIKPAHLYFALGEIPFFAGLVEENRGDPFSGLPDQTSLCKGFLLHTRDLMEADGKCLKISPARLQATLTYLTKLSSEDQQLMPDLFNWVTASKGVLGDSFGAKLLEQAQAYPFLPGNGPFLKLGMEKIRTPFGSESEDAWNILSDIPRTWKTIKLRKDPRPEESKKWQGTWNPSRSCSHLPEDLIVERFNLRARQQTLRTLQAQSVRTMPFSSSLLDGIDIRETIRHWHKGELWVKETPPQRGKLDTVIILFDENHDERYPHRCTWYAEHVHESTLSFFSTDPMADLIGPGIARARYGGLSMIFPPRHTPDLFQVKGPDGLSASEQLAYASMLYSGERLVAYIAPRRPGIRLREIARKLKKHLVWTPLSHFRLETLEKLRTFHILNGQHIRTIASKYIGF
jgi:hypothetical protein